MFVNCLSNEIMANKYYVINPYNFIIGQHNTKEEAREQARKLSRLEKDNKISFMILRGSDLLKLEIVKELPLISY